MLQVLSCGFLVADIIVAGLDKIAAPGEVVFAPQGIRLAVGGHPANIAVDLVKLGVNSSEIGVSGAVGNDIFGKFIEQTLRSYGLKLYIERIEASTNKNVILVVKGEDRRFHVELGASRLLSPQTVLRLLKETQPHIFYLASGILDKIDEKIEEIFRKAEETGALTFADIVTPHRKQWSYIIPALKHVHIFHCNEAEAKALTNAQSLGQAIRRVLDWGVKLVLVTRGNEGAVAATKHLKIIQRGCSVEVVDPTGAGDAFCAGVIHELLRQKTGIEELTSQEAEQLAKMLLYAQAVGASACTAPGTTEGVSSQKVENLIKTQGYSILSDTTIKPLSE